MSGVAGPGASHEGTETLGKSIRPQNFVRLAADSTYRMTVMLQPNHANQAQEHEASTLARPDRRRCRGRTDDGGECDATPSIPPAKDGTTSYSTMLSGSARRRKRGGSTLRLDGIAQQRHGVTHKRNVLSGHRHGAAFGVDCSVAAKGIPGRRPFLPRCEEAGGGWSAGGGISGEEIPGWRRRTRRKKGGKEEGGGTPRRGKWDPWLAMRRPARKSSRTYHK